MSQLDLCHELFYTEKRGTFQTVFTLLRFAAMDTCVRFLKRHFPGSKFCLVFFFPADAVEKGLTAVTDCSSMSNYHRCIDEDTVCGSSQDP